MGSVASTNRYPPFSGTFTQLGSAIDLGTSEVQGTLSIANGGTNSTTVSGAQQALEVEVGVDVQAFSPALTVFATNSSDYYLARGNHTGTQDVSTVTGLGEFATLLTTVPVVSGGTGSSTVSGAQQALEVEVGVDVQAYSPALTVFASNSSDYYLARDNHTGTQNVSTITGLGEFATLLTVVPVVSGGTGSPTASGARVNLGLEIDVDVQSFSVELSSLDALATNGIVVRTGTGAHLTRSLSAGLGVSIVNNDGTGADPGISIGQEVGTLATPSFSGVDSTGSDKKKYEFVTGNVTINHSHNAIYFDGTLTAQLPPVAQYDGYIVTLKNIGSGTVTVSGDIAETIDGLNTISLSTQWAHMVLQATLSGWYVIG